MGTRSPSWAPGLIDRGRQRVRGIAFGRLTFKASQNNKPLARGVETHRASSSSRKKVSSAKGPTKKTPVLDGRLRRTWELVRTRSWLLLLCGSILFPCLQPVIRRISIHPATSLIQLISAPTDLFLDFGIG